jgi:predicted PurR-regulated permease PerM
MVSRGSGRRDQSWYLAARRAVADWLAPPTAPASPDSASPDSDGRHSTGAAAARPTVPELAATAERASAPEETVEDAPVATESAGDGPLTDQMGTVARDGAAASGGSSDASSGLSGREPVDVPRWLRTGAAFSWRLILVGATLYLLARIAAYLSIVVIPCTAALLLTALLQPLEARLKRHGFGPMAATWTALLTAIIVLAGVGALVTNRVQAEYPSLVMQVRHTSLQLQNWLAGPPLHLHTANIESILGNFVTYLSQHRSAVEGTVVTGGKIVTESLAGVVLMFFVTFFLMKDGERIWQWITGELRPGRRERVNRAGHAAWSAVVHYIRGTVVIAAIHAIVMAVMLTIMDAPLVAPLALLMFVGAFVPIVGALVAGALAVLVVLAVKGWVFAVIVACVLVAMSQIESHILQPQVVGKMVHLHPLAVILVLAIGSVVAGIYGAVIAVPLTAAVSRAIPELRRPKSGAT